MSTAEIVVVALVPALLLAALFAGWALDYWVDTRWRDFERTFWRKQPTHIPYRWPRR